MDIASISIAGLALALLALLSAVLYLLYTIRKLLFRISVTLDSIDQNSAALAIVLSGNPMLLKITKTLRMLNRELKRYIKRN